MKTNVENQADAWVAVYNTLFEVAPDLMINNPKCGREVACDAVRTLASEADQLTKALKLSVSIITELTAKCQAQQKQLNTYRHFA